MSPRFTSPPDPRLFENLVWQIVRQIPAGKVCTYGRIAALLPIPAGMTPPDYAAFAPRWVGGAMARCPQDVPWQRVVNAQGKISLRPGGEEQRRLLEAEGIVFSATGKIDLKRFGWSGPSESEA